MVEARAPERGTVRAAAGRRITGVDAARMVAIAGMVSVHIGPRADEAGGTLGDLYALPHGRASILFAVLAGAGVSLMAGARTPARLRATRLRLVSRAVLLLPVGLALQLLDHGVLVILQYYAAYFVVAALLAGASDRLLLPLAGGWLLAGPVAYLAVWHWQPGWFDSAATALTDPPADVARDLLVSGSYPVVTWTAALLFGLWIGRRDLRRAGTRWWMLGGGLAVAVAAWLLSSLLVAWVGEPSTEPSWAQLALDEPHSQMPLWLLGAVGSATAVLGGALLLADRFPRLSWPLAAGGQLALTIYVGHLFVLAAWPWLLRRDAAGDAATVVVLFTVVVAAAAVAWRAAFSRGPLEAALRLPELLRQALR